MVHPSWHEAVQEYRTILIPKLMEHGKEIGRKGVAGDEICKKIMKYYEMLRRSFDPMTYILLQEEFEKYLAASEPCGRTFDKHLNLQNITIRTELGRRIRKGFFTK